MLLEFTPVSSKAFAHIAETKKLVVEISDFDSSPFHQLYDDAVDFGVRLHSSRTGGITTWSAIECYNEDNELTHWELTPIPKASSVLHNFVDTAWLLSTTELMLLYPK